MNATEKLELQVSESQDGGATVELPAGEMPELAEGGEASRAEANDDDIDDRAEDGEDPDRTAIREARREERRLKKSIHREKAKESNHLINALKTQNNQLAERLAHLESRTSGAELARVDKMIDDAGVQVEYAKMKIRQAVSDQDGDGMVKAQEMLYNAQRQMESLSNTKDQAVKHMSKPAQQNINLPDPNVQRLAAEWMAENPWYDPQGQDQDSEIAQLIDKRLTKEGFDPASEDYWEELSDRINKKMPHVNDRQPARQRPRSPVGSSGRESAPAGRANEFRVSPERVQAMKEMGAWDNPEMRARMIKSYAKYDRENKGRN
jgi:hypothetical protein